MNLVGRSLPTTRGGYTLVEMIIAMVLVSVLMSSVWTIMSLYNSLLTAGRDRTTEQQLVRSLFELMHDDLAGVNVAEPTPSMMEFGDTLNDLTFVAPLPSAATNTGLQPSPFEEQPFDGRQTTEAESRVGELSLSGTSTALRLRIRTFEPPTFHTASDMDLLNELGGGSAMQQQDVGNVTEFQTVVYQMITAENGGSADSVSTVLVPGLYRIQSDTQSVDALEAGQSTAELQRQVNSIEISRQNLLLLMQAEDQLTLASEPDSRDFSNLPQADIESIPEVINCRFEYFDGSRWLSSWTADRLQGLPEAVRISLDVVSQKDLRQRDETYPLPTTDLTSAPEASASETISSHSTDDLYPQAIAARRYSRTILLTPTDAGLPGGSL
ncbi:MAG: prepilin-type N-terminal cleavage/methylation domain-containing protein [Planctomycetaceae bacterium]|nr:prepilin-type N-terminal cleavage/methylation domain-containing protein [Planctomycetaceae bacterium]